MVANEYAKVVLYAYPYLPALSDAVGVGAVNKAMLSFRSSEDALGTAERIAEELAVKFRLMRLNEAVDAALAGMSEEELFLLEYKYFRRRRVLRERFAACRPDWSERTYYRRQNAVLRKFAAALVAQGWPERAYFSAFSSFPPFSRVYDAISAGREGAVVGKRSRGERGAP